MNRRGAENIERKKSLRRLLGAKPEFGIGKILGSVPSPPTIEIVASVAKSAYAD